MSDQIERVQCQGVVMRWAQNRYTKGWYLAGKPRRCAKLARPSRDTCHWHAGSSRRLDGATGLVESAR